MLTRTPPHMSLLSKKKNYDSFITILTWTSQLQQSKSLPLSITTTANKSSYYHHHNYLNITSTLVLNSNKPPPPLSLLAGEVQLKKSDRQPSQI